jgi:hypothetical protein
LQARIKEQDVQTAHLTAQLQVERATREALGEEDGGDDADHATAWAKDGCTCAAISSFRAYSYSYSYKCQTLTAHLCFACMT